MEDRSSVTGKDSKTIIANQRNSREIGYIGMDTHLPPYLPYPRFLLKMEITQAAKLLYALLLDRVTLSQKNGWQDEYGRTYIIFPVMAIADALDRSPSTIKEEIPTDRFLKRRSINAGFIV